MRNIHKYILCIFLIVISLCTINGTLSTTDDNFASKFEQNVLDLLRGAQQEHNNHVSELNQQQQNEELRFQSTVAQHIPNASSLIDSGVNLADSINDILNAQKQQNQDTFKALLLEQKQHETIEKEFSKQREKLRERAVFLERMQSCMNEGTSTSLLNQRNAQLDERQRTLDKLEYDIKKHQEQLAQREAVLLAREEHILRKEDAINKAIKNDETARINLENKAKDLKTQLLEIENQEKDLLSRIENLSKRENNIITREKDINNIYNNIREQQHRFSEIRVQNRESLYKDEGDVCLQYDQCTGCIANPKCGWCSAGSDSSTGKCLSHNVNALSDGLTSGQCSIKSWYSKVSDRLTALNLNVFGGDLADKEQRSAALFNVIISAKYPDIIALQEVSEWFITLLKDQVWFKKYYHMTDFKTSAPPGGLLILSRFNITKTVYSEQFENTMNAIDQRPKILIAHIELGGKIITAATTSLDWRSSESRVDALNFITGLTENADNLLLLGDLNFDEGAEPETSNIPTSWIDVWPRVYNGTDDNAASKIQRGPNRYGFTWDPATNWYARYSDPNSRPSRIDRIFLRSTIMLPREIYLVGCPGPDYLCQDPPASNAPTKMIPFQPRMNQVTGNVIYPSSHYGLLASFSVFMPHC